eukprot:6433800-Prymnesium_polylepis.1
MKEIYTRISWYTCTCREGRAGPRRLRAHAQKASVPPSACRPTGRGAATRLASLEREAPHLCTACAPRRRCQLA